MITIETLVLIGILMLLTIANLKLAIYYLDSKESKVWLYSLKNTVRNKDYNSIYNELQDNITSKIFYNTSVYDFEAWGPKDIYNYIYILVLGVALFGARA